MRNWLILLSILLLPAQALAAQPPLRVMATFSILADIAQRVGGDAVTVEALVGPNADPHAFNPTAADAARVMRADVLFMNGLGMEGWIERLIDSTGFRGTVVVATARLKSPLSAHAGQDEDHAHHHHDHGVYDPHAWQNPQYGILYVQEIANALIALRPHEAAAIRARADSYIGELKALDAMLRGRFAALSDDRRVVLTVHQAFDYLGDAYGLTFKAPIGLATLDEPGAQEIAALIDFVRVNKASALFLENMANPTILQQISHETGAGIGGKLYTDALSEAGGPAPTYIELLRHNGEAIAAALRERP